MSAHDGVGPIGLGGIAGKVRAYVWQTVQHQIAPYWRVVSIFALALTLRLYHNLVLLNLPVCGLNDAFYFLRTGSALLQWLSQGASLPALIQQPLSGGTPWQVMTSVSLPERLLIDGPVYPAYLALIEWLSGVKPDASDFESYCQALAMCNSLVDSLTCLLVYLAGRLAFSRRTGFVAGVIAAVYPGAVINTQHCYSEPFACFLLTVWCCLLFAVTLRHCRGRVRRILLWTGLGMVGGMVMLVKPAFVVVPPVVLVGLAVWRLSAALTVPPQASSPGRQPAPTPVTPGEKPEPETAGPAAGGADAPIESGAENPEISEISGHPEKPAGEPGAEVGAGGQPAGDPETDSHPPEAKASGALPEVVDQPGGEARKPEAAGDAGGRWTGGTMAWTGNVALLAGGMAVVLVPWLWFTSLVSGRAVPFVDRLPALNLYAGNRLETDGWMKYPPEADLPRTIVGSLRAIAGLACEHPLPFIGLQLRKIPRLWAGVWNEYQYALPFFDVYRQSIFHQLLLFSAALGGILLVAGARKPRLSREFTCGCLLVAVALLHFVYCLFEPVSRYNATAMPSVILLASYAAVRLSGDSAAARWRLAGVLVLVAMLLRLMQGGSSLYAYLVSLVPGSLSFLLGWLDGLFWAAAWLIICAVTLPLVARAHNRRAAGVLIAGMFTLLVLLALVSSTGDPARQEWFCDLRNPQQVLRQDVYVTPVAAAASLAPQAFVLIDLAAPVLLPRLSVAINGERIDNVPLTWLQVHGNQEQLLEALSSRAHAMGRDLRSFRQWWVIPVPLSVLRLGASNEILIKSEDREAILPTRIYGDYGVDASGSGEGLTVLPSFERMSLTKGFATYDHRDARIYQPVRLLGKEVSSYWFDGKRWVEGDLSESPGRQTGAFRVRIALVERKSVPLAAEPGPAGLARPAAEAQFSPPPVTSLPFVVADIRGPKTVAGWDPLSMLLTSSSLKIPADLPVGCVFHFSCELRDFDAYGSAFVSVQFLGERNGSPVTWTSPWQPRCIPLGVAWTRLSFADIIPDDVLRLDKLRVSIMVCPFHADALLTKRQQALRQTAMVQNASLVLLPPLLVPPAEQRVWLIY